MTKQEFVTVALVFALAGTGYFAYNEHQQISSLQDQLSTAKSDLKNEKQQSLELWKENMTLKTSQQASTKQDQPAQSSDTGNRSAFDQALMDDLDEENLRQKEADLLDNVNRNLDQQYYDNMNKEIENATKTEIIDFTK